MKQRLKYLSSLLCLLAVSVLFSTASAQSLPSQAASGESVGAGLTVHNSIVWENVFGSVGLSKGSHNLVSEDPLFASATDFFLQASSPAIGKGDNSKNSFGFDIAGVAHAAKMNIGAYENNKQYTVTIVSPLKEEGTLAVYQGTTLVKNLAKLKAGTELKVTVIPADGYRLDKLTANGGAIKNGEIYILSGDTEFKGELLQGNGRPIAYATAKSGTGKFNVYNTIIYNNADDYGAYSLDKTNVVANPNFASATEFALKTSSVALGKGNGLKLSTGSSDIAGMDIISSGTDAPINAGAYQSAAYMLNWDVSVSGGTLEVFYLEENEAKQKVRKPATEGGSYAATTIVVKITPVAGYQLQEIKVNDQLLTVTKGETSFELGANTVITVKFRSFAGDNKATVYQPTGGILKFKNNIVYGNITVTDEGEYKSNMFAESPVPANVADDTNNLDGNDPLFYNDADFRLQNGSPVIDKGDNSVVTTDMKDLAGYDRIYNNGTVDLGAYEVKEELAYTVTFGWTDLKDKYGKVYASVEVKTADGNVINSGDKVPAGSVINIAYTIENTDNYEWFGQVGLTGVGTNYLPDGVTTFTLEEDTRISVPIRLKKYVVTYGATNGALKVYSGTTLIPSGEEVSYETLLTVIATPDEYHELAFVAVNGQHIDGAETAGGYIVTVTSETTITASFVPLYELDADGEPELIEQPPLGDPNDPSNWKPALVKGLITWDALNGIIKVTNTDDAYSAVNSGDLLPAGTKIHVDIVPVAVSGYKLVLVELNGQSYPYTSFDWKIPAEESGAIASTFIGVRYEAETDPVPPVTPGISYQVTTGVTGNGTLTIKNGNTVVQSGQSIASGTVLTLQAVPATGYVLSSLTVNGKLALSGSEITVLENTSIMALFDKEQKPGDPDLEKQVYVTVVGNGTVTLQDGITAVMIESGDWVDNNTSLLLTATASTGYELTSLQVNGMDVTSGGSFTVTTTTNVIAVFSRKGETPTPPVTPPVGPSETEYVTLTIGSGLPAGITMNPGTGSYQIVKGSNQILCLTLDGRYDGQYIYLKVNDRYVLLREPGTTRELTYTLVNITGGMSIGVVVSATPDPDPDDPSGNAVVENGTRIWSESGSVCIQSETAGNVRIITFNGRIIKQQNLPAGETRIPLADGFYVVVLSDGTTSKVAVRNF